MKKLILILSIILFIIFMSNKEYNLEEDSIRFRVIANSNSARDIIMKEKVVNELSNMLFDKTRTFDETNKNIYSNLKNIENRIDNLFERNNYNKVYNISYGLNEFPKKEYRGKTYPAGTYKSLVIEIGDAKGNNYFCILYPSLCMLDYEEINKSNKTSNKNINEEKNIEYRFKIVDLFKNMF